MIDMADYIRYVAALAFVVALILGLAYLLRKLGTSSFMNGGRGRGDKRLGIVEVQPIDPKRRLVLISHDDREHLVLLGHERDLVIEAGRPKTGSITSQPATDITSNPDEPHKLTAPRYIPGSRSTGNPTDNGH
ncbi:MAG: hypothetical protein CL558_02900 [Alphaproteobacteria bacterium]|nr:hypothetical protein [Alphaproteobacteria bacterium]MAS49104.1 hypothetical protein [Alphaproteobacteria bacterium]MAX97294.1 hypothetical protein [Alphaproteobacteria bacterium]MBN52508.1 hypothetical protein [Alphaproteobacteria bacterium]|tara:strand:- start:1267 stop:1665 length:399 start_codon:yes stop_codon:yes gene_type:complete